MIALFTASLFVAASFRQGPASSLGAVTLNDLSFIAGRWHGVDGDAQVDEHWTAPEGDNMMGMFRVVRNGKLSIYEMMSIEKSDSGITMHLKQFKFGLANSAEKPDVIDFKLGAFEPGVATFNRVNGTSRIVFRKNGPDGLNAILTKDGVDLPYIYTRSSK